MHVAVAKAVVQHCYPRWRPRWLPQITDLTITATIRINYILFSYFGDTTNSLLPGVLYKGYINLKLWLN